MLICVTVLILKRDLFNYFHIGNVNTQNNVDEPGPQLVVEPPPQGLFPLSDAVKTSDAWEEVSGIFTWQAVMSGKYIRLPMAERVGRGTPCLSWSLGVREVVGSRPGRGNSKESFSSNQETGKVFSPEMPFYSKF